MIDSFFWKLTFILDLNTQNWSQLVRQNVFKSRLIQDGLSVRRNVAVSLFATRDTPSAVSLCTDQKNIQLLKEAAHRNTCTGVTSHANVLSFAVGYFLIRSKSGTKKREDFLRPLLQKATSLIWKRMSDGKQELVVQHLAFWSKAAMTSKHSQHWQSWQAAWRAGTGKGQSQTAKRKKKCYQKLSYSLSVQTLILLSFLWIQGLLWADLHSAWLHNENILHCKRLETSEVVPSISPFPPPPGRDHIKATRDSWDQRPLGTSEHLAPMRGDCPQITVPVTHWRRGDFPYSSSVWWKAGFGRREPLNVTSKVHLNFLLTLAQSQAFSRSTLVFFLNPNQMKSFLDLSFWELQLSPSNTTTSQTSCTAGKHRFKLSNTPDPNKYGHKTKHLPTHSTATFCLSASPSN